MTPPCLTTRHVGSHQCQLVGSIFSNIMWLAGVGSIFSTIMWLAGVGSIFSNMWLEASFCLLTTCTLSRRGRFVLDTL